MKPEAPGARRWWRSWLFLLGLPGLIFLLWVWCLFPTRVLSVDAGQRIFEVRAFPEALEVTMIKMSGLPPRWEAEAFPIEADDRVDDGDHVLKWDFQRFPDVDEPFYYVSMRAWVPTALYLVLWLGGLALWQFWRKRRVAACRVVSVDERREEAS